MFKKNFKFTTISKRSIVVDGQVKLIPVTQVNEYKMRQKEIDDVIKVNKRIYDKWMMLPNEMIVWV